MGADRHVSEAKGREESSGNPKELQKSLRVTKFIVFLTME